MSDAPPFSLDELRAEMTSRVIDVLEWCHIRIAMSDHIIRGEVELHGTDLPEALAERRALREVVRMLEGRDG
jgi:hypothetical protein